MSYWDDYSDQPHDVFVDITPILVRPFGDRLTLGTVRYKVPKEWLATRSDAVRVTDPIRLDGYPMAAMESLLQFKVETQWADHPQPEPLPVAPESDGVGYRG